MHEVGSRLGTVSVGRRLEGLEGAVRGSEGPAFASYGAAAFARAKTGEGGANGNVGNWDGWMGESMNDRMNGPNAEWAHYNSVIGRSDAVHKECENPFSLITRAP